jgi:serine/threonine protein kinase
MDSGMLDVGDAVRIARQMAEAIDAEHRRGTALCNLQPSNIVLSHNEQGQLQTRIANFNDPQLEEQMLSSEGHPPAPSELEAARYLSPEQCAGGSCSARSDIYSLGAMLYEMLAGHAPFDGFTAREIARLHVEKMPPRLEMFRGEALQPLVNLVMQALQKNPALRPSAAEVARSLRYLEYITAKWPRTKPAVTIPSRSPEKPAPTQIAPPVDAEQNKSASLAPPVVTTSAPAIERSENIPAAPDSFTDAAEEGARETDFAPQQTEAEPISPPPVFSQTLSSRTNAPVETEIFAAPRTSAKVGAPRARNWQLASFIALFLGVGLLALLAFIFSAQWLAPRLSSTPTVSPAPTVNQAPVEHPSNNSGAQNNRIIIQTPNINSAHTSRTKQPNANTAQANVSSANVNTNITATRPHNTAPAATTQTELQNNLAAWVAATNARDTEKQMSFYAPKLDVFYRTRNVSRAAVRAEKARAIGRASTVNVRVSNPEIAFSPDNLTAIMRFRKQYTIDNRRGEVLQELRWQKTGAGWKIVGERDVHVIR